MNSPVVTVIVPGRDVADFAQEAIDSLLNQTMTAWRAVLVDDGSADATGAIFAAATQADSRFSVVTHPSSRGLSAARNSGLDLVATPLVAFLDADDRYTPTALERLAATISASGSDVAVGAYVRLRPAAGEPDGAYTVGTVQPWVAAATDPARTATSLREHPALSGNIVAWSKISRIEFWRRHGLRFPEGRLYEDQVLAQQMYALARGVDVIPEVIVHWRERADGSSITQNKHTVPVLTEYLDAMRGGLAVLDDHDLTDAAAARVQLILEMDVPPLITIAAGHPDAAYRRALGAFVRDFSARAEADGITIAPAVHPHLLAARLW